VLDILQRPSPARDPQREWEELQAHGIRLLCLGDGDYPANLTVIPDPPAVLFIQGALEPRDLLAVAVVGSRAASPVGMAFTERLCADLARHGVTIVSGLAVGIDGSAHRGAVNARGRTIAVLGCGLDVDYPRSNRGLRDRIRASGALMTEFLLGTLPEPGHFPARNRIISGLSLGVLVVEAASRSGSLITARLALEQGREVFAVPGMARHYRSIGPHRLLREGAKLVEGAEDILEEILPLVRVSVPAPDASPAVPAFQAPAGPREENEEEGAVMKLLRGEPLHVDDIARALQWPITRVLTILLSLELDGKVHSLPGKYYTQGAGR
jgi:DNA processing protein